MSPDVEQALADLRTAVENLRVELGEEAAAAVDAVSVKVDEVQAAWEARNE